MSLISQINVIEKKISGQILFDESLSKYSWFNCRRSLQKLYLNQKT